MTKLKEMDDSISIAATFASKKTITLPEGFVTPRRTRLAVEESAVYSPVLSIPKLPVIQPYSPTDGDAIPVYSIAMKMPGLVSHIPAGIADLLAEHGILADDLDIGLVVQNNTGTNAIFRPNAWLHKDAPKSQAGYGVRTPDILVGTCSIGTSPILLKPSKAIHTHQAGSSVVFSPNNLGIDGLQSSENIALYSVVINRTISPAKAIVTLHVLCSPDLHTEMLEIGGKEEERTCAQIIDEMLSLSSITSQSQLVLALQNFKDGTPVPSHTYSDNSHSLQDTYYTASAILQANLASKGFNLSAIDAQNVHTMTPLTYSVGKRNMDCIRACLAKGANPELKNGFGKSPLQIAKDAGDIEVVELLKATIERRKINLLYKFCTKYGFDFYNLEKENIHGVTPITVAASHNVLDILNILLERNVKIFTPNSHGNTAINIAERKGFVPIQESLKAHSLVIIERFAQRYGFDKDNLDAENTHGVTMLTVAIEKNMPEVVHALVENGADVELANSWGKTPLSIARRIGSEKLISYLESKLEADEPGPRSTDTSPRNTI